MKHKLSTKPVKSEDLTFEDLYEEISRDWQAKATALQARRWQKLGPQTDNHRLRYSTRYSPVTPRNY